MSLSKETLEPASPDAKTAAPAAQSKPDLSKLRADAVSLDVPVRVHGSRVTNVVRGVTPHTEPFEEEASTMIVFPHGGVVRMATAVGVGQMLVLTNLRTSQDAICRVVKVRAYSNSQAYVEVEFTHRHVGYWGVRFPADDEDSFPAAAPSAAATPEPEKKPVLSSVAVKVEAMPKIPAAPPRSESAFAPIGSQEEVQPPAAHTELKTRIAPPASAPSQPTRIFAPAASIAAPAIVSPPLRSSVPVESGPEGADIGEIEEPRPARTFGTLTGGAGRTLSGPVVSDLGSRPESAPFQGQSLAPRSNNSMWIAACVFFLVAGLAGGAFYFRQHSAQTQEAMQAPVPSHQPAQPAAPAPVASSSPSQISQPDESAAPISALPNAIAERPNRSETKAPEPQSRLANDSSLRESRLSAPTAAPTAKNFTPANARPVTRAIESSRMAPAPSLSTPPAVNAVSGSEALPGVLNSTEAAPPPPPPSQQPLTRVRVGGVIAQPRLLHSVPPNYPSAARNAGISGNVVILAHVDKTGNVASMKVVSGPATLQSAAMSALRNWKYQPATLDGVPIATDVTVTIKFQQQ